MPTRSVDRQPPLPILALPATPTKRAIVGRDVEALAHWMDSAFRIPGLGVRVGFDSILGLIPGIGDAGTTIVSLYILSAAHRSGVPRVTLARMALNIALDAVIGAVPLLGDLFDVAFKANQRNIELLRRTLADLAEKRSRNVCRDRWFMALLLVALGALIAGSVALAYTMFSWLGEALSRLL